MTPEAATIAFPNGNTLAMQAAPDHLAMQATTPDTADLATFRDVVDRHILRFAFREELVIDWS